MPQASTLRQLRDHVQTRTDCLLVQSAPHLSKAATKHSNTRASTGNTAHATAGVPSGVGNGPIIVHRLSATPAPRQGSGALLPRVIANGAADLVNLKGMSANELIDMDNASWLEVGKRLQVRH